VVQNFLVGIDHMELPLVASCKVLHHVAVNGFRRPLFTARRTFSTTVQIEFLTATWSTNTETKIFL
jgi:hypothetical protein